MKKAKKFPTVLELYDLQQWKAFVKSKKIDPYSRRQPKLKDHHITPKKNDGYCDCGCWKKLEGRQSRWATKECSNSTWQLYNILQSSAKDIRPLLKERDGYFCKHCCLDGRAFDWTDTPTLQVDHILPVCKGGGGMGLWNFQFICKDCHKDKTKIDIQKS